MEVEPRTEKRYEDLEGGLACLVTVRLLVRVLDFHPKRRLEIAGDITYTYIPYCKQQHVRKRMNNTLPKVITFTIARRNSVYL